MAIEPNMLSVQSISRDSSSSLPTPVIMRIVPSDPAGQYSYVYDDATQTYTATSIEPTGDNQLCVYENPDIGPYRFELYRSLRIVGSTDPTREPRDDYWVWQRMPLPSDTRDSRTGEPYDPLAEFYNPLAN